MTQKIIIDIELVEKLAARSHPAWALVLLPCTTGKDTIKKLEMQ